MEKVAGFAIVFWKVALEGAKAACLVVEDRALLDPKANAREERIRMLRDMALVEGNVSEGVVSVCADRECECKISALMIRQSHTSNAMLNTKEPRSSASSL